METSDGYRGQKEAPGCLRRKQRKIETKETVDTVNQYLKALQLEGKQLTGKTGRANKIVLYKMKN